MARTEAADRNRYVRLRPAVGSVPRRGLAADPCRALSTRRGDSATSRKQEYRDAPDGLPARIVGEWVARKSFYLRRYMDLFAGGMKNKWDRRCYIELFAGPGVSWDRRNRVYVQGSALLALEYPFTDYFFVDIDPHAISALRQRADAKRTEAKQTDRALWTRVMDCNDAVDELLPALPHGGIHLVFVDPTAAQVRFSTIEKLAAVPHTDLLFTFHVSAFRRAWRSRAKEIDAFFPPGADWRRAVRLPRDKMLGALLSLYLSGLDRYGYQQDGLEVVPMRHSKNGLMYVLVLFTQHPRGQDFWRKATAAEETGQERLFAWL